MPRATSLAHRRPSRTAPTYRPRGSQTARPSARRRRHRAASAVRWRPSGRWFWPPEKQGHCRTGVVRRQQQYRCPHPCHWHRHHDDGDRDPGNCLSPGRASAGQRGHEQHQERVQDGRADMNGVPIEAVDRLRDRENRQFVGEERDVRDGPPVRSRLRSRRSHACNAWLAPSAFMGCVFDMVGTRRTTRSPPLPQPRRQPPGASD